ncbi:TonB-dependent receptor [Halioxenophilus sp. WMMB6]|uniref:TonB-dependent siderophore receptor n=1 Tax=Halioxenophilus sp. WMMB6 TaxID=3073815 RepID=UPI00295E981A|nr:TonB-dependent receptor [Halioxenophilus sp. WMMB6]
MKRSFLASSIAAALATLAVPSVFAEDDGTMETVSVEASADDKLGILSSEPVDSVFGFGKSVYETPRSVSSVSAEFLEEFNITGINDIATFIPGSFTTSFFGVAGSLDIRGTPADNYFRGVKRLNNDGIFPTPIGASDRIDVIRGPMSPISGPSRVGGALNFIPKSARADTGAYMDDASGQFGYTFGKWDKSVIRAEVGGPMTVGSKKAGYYIFAEVENSGSYYENDFNDQTLVQGSFNVDLNATTRIEFGGMYQNWDGHENGGWNRVTQDLIDNGTYITGQPNYTPPDVNGDGLMNDAEISSGFTDSAFGPGVTCFGGSVQLFCVDSTTFGAADPADFTADSIPAQYGITPTGTAHLDHSQVLITDEDLYKTEATTLYFDIIHETMSGWTFTNKLFYDSAESRNSDSYGFSKAGDTYVIEDQFIVAKKFESDMVTADVQFSPSVRYTDAWYANDFVHEIFDRTDLTVGFLPASQQASSVNNGTVSEPWGINDYSEAMQYGLAFLTDMSFFKDLNVLVGVRYDYVEIEGRTGTPAAFFSRTPGAKASDEDDAVSYTFSVSYNLPFGVNIYGTTAKQSTILAGTHDAVELGLIQDGNWLGESEMNEIGIKGQLFSDRLFFGISTFDQERVSINSNVAESNEALQSEGYEVELRWVPIDPLSIIATYSNTEVTRTDLGGAMFTYLGAADLPQLDPTLIWGGAVSGVFFTPEDEPSRGGVPENVYSLSAAYRFNDNWAANVSWTNVDSVEPSPMGGLVLPSYDIVNASVSYVSKEFEARLALNNVTNEEYYRANFPGLYGNLSVLPEKPFSYTVDLTYKF